MHLLSNIHATDIAIHAAGDTMPELFLNALRGMNEILKEGLCGAQTHYDCSSKIEVYARDRRRLLIDFLSEVLEKSYAYRAVFCYVYFSEFSENHLEARLYGVWFNQFDIRINSVACEDASVEQNARGTWDSTLDFELEE
ncbi:archease [Robiginitalea sp. SC105]|uniref:archease n=1 Tax=Robiginitalea sp. SC105 TaxID=2762332 RepID=UPI0016398B1B|nr:archease [Robiginitalea sp. SC105]MBC2840271.1 archease [Robiginitalea sp. SC105]